MSVTLAHLLYATQDATFPTGEPEVWLTLTGAIGYAALFAMLGVVLGHLIRNQVAAIVGALAWLLVIENLLINFSTDISRWLPGGAGQAIVRTPQPGLLDPLPATALLAAYTTAIAIAGLYAAANRDAAPGPTSPPPSVQSCCREPAPHRRRRMREISS